MSTPYKDLLFSRANSGGGGGGGTNYQTKDVTPTESAQTIMADTGYDAIRRVNLAAISSSYVGSAVPTQAAATITPTTSSQTAVESGKYTTGAVTVAAIPDEYVIPTGTKSITANGTVNVAGYASASVNVSGGSATLVTKSISSNGTYSASDDDADGYSQVTVNVPSGQPTLQTKSVSYTPTESAQTASVTADNGYDGLEQVNVTVGAIASDYVGTGVSRQAAATITPTTSSQTAVAANKYTTGAVTVEGVVCANLTASNIVSGVTVKIGTATDDDSVAIVTGTASGGGGAVESNDVNFYDYDGTLLYSYSAADFANLSALPANPTHTGLTAQGWNWSLSDAKTYVASYGMLDIGQMYVTDDGKTRLYIHYSSETIDASRTMQVRFKPSVSTGVTIDWGDGTTSVSSSTNITDYSHHYDSNGDYVITLTATSGTYEFLGSSTETIIGQISNANSYKQVYLRKVEIGANVSGIGQYTFKNLISLESITIPAGLKLSGTDIFNTCRSLKALIVPTGQTVLGNNFVAYASINVLSLPNGVTSVGDYFCRECCNLERLAFPESVTSIGSGVAFVCYVLKKVVLPPGITTLADNAFSSCPSVERLDIPESVTTIGSSALNSTYWGTIKIPKNVTSIGSNFCRYAYGLFALYLYPVVPPTLDSNPFGSVASNAVFYVPTGSLSAYQSATNWSAYASKMQEEQP